MAFSLVSAVNNSGGAWRHGHPADTAHVSPTASHAPHGCHISHPDEFNAALLDFLAR